MADRGRYHQVARGRLPTQPIQLQRPALQEGTTVLFRPKVSVEQVFRGSTCKAPCKKIGCTKIFLNYSGKWYIVLLQKLCTIKETPLKNEGTSKIKMRKTL